MSKSYKGSCFCNAVELTVTGEPEAAGFCHCASCRSWSASPVNAFSLWKPDAVKITKGQEYIGEYHLDRVGGSWWHELGTTNEVSRTVWAGKADLYHAVQATLIPRLPLTPVIVPALAAGLLD